MDDATKNQTVPIPEHINRRESRLRRAVQRVEPPILSFTQVKPRSSETTSSGTTTPAPTYDISTSDSITSNIIISSNDSTLTIPPISPAEVATTNTNSPPEGEVSTSPDTNAPSQNAAPINPNRLPSPRDNTPLVINGQEINREALPLTAIGTNEPPITNEPIQRVPSPRDAIPTLPAPTPKPQKVQASPRRINEGDIITRKDINTRNSYRRNSNRSRRDGSYRSEYPPATPNRIEGNVGNLPPIIPIQPVRQSTKPSNREVPVQEFSHSRPSSRSDSQSQPPPNDQPPNEEEIPDYNSMDEEYQEYWRAKFRGRFIRLKEAFPFLDLPDISNIKSLRYIHKLYDDYYRLGMSVNSKMKYRLMLIIYFIILEGFLIKVMGFNATGFTVSQVRSLAQYDLLLLELSEKNQNFASTWPVEIKILVLGLINAVGFIIINWIGPNGLELIFKAIGSVQGQPTNSGGFDPSNILGIITGVLFGNNNQPPPEKPNSASEEKERKHYRPRHSE